MEFYEAGATIDAPPSRVWQVLTDGLRYTEWDSGVEKLEGSLEDGQKIKVYSTVSPGRAFPVNVALEPETTMTWTGGMPLGLFKGVRTFRVSPSGSGATFHMREEFTGPLLGMIWKTMPDLQPSFDQFAAGLKQESERNS